MSESGYVKANIESIGKELELLPEIGDEERRVSTKDAVQQLMRPIRGLQRKGYSIERIVKVLGERGLSITAHTLRGYLRTPRKKQQKGDAGPENKVADTGHAVADRPSLHTTAAAKGSPPASIPGPAPAVRREPSGASGSPAQRTG